MFSWRNKKNINTFGLKKKKERLKIACLTSDHEVLGTNPAGGEIQLMTARRFIEHRAFRYHPSFVSV